MEREMTETSLRLRNEAEQNLVHDEQLKREAARRREQEIVASDQTDEEKEKLLKAHRAEMARMEVCLRDFRVI